MKLAISNIGWAGEYDNRVYSLMEKYGYTGLEIAPTRIFPENPYEQLTEAKQWVDWLAATHRLTVASMQSIWYGRTEKIFGSANERERLVSYTKNAIRFAEIIGCSNLVFGCPKNRSIPEDGNIEIAIQFFKEIGDYAFKHHTIVALEANPPVYNTNFINTTKSAIELVERVDSKGFLLNLDMGTMVENGETLDVLKGKGQLLNHVHISEPGLKPIQHREIHNHLADYLRNEGYDRFVSIEVGKQESTETLVQMMKYVEGIFR